MKTAYLKTQKCSNHFVWPRDDAHRAVGGEPQVVAGRLMIDASPLKILI